MTRRPLVITDCDEVLLHFVQPFADYLEAHHDLELRPDSFALVGNIRRRADGRAIPAGAVEPLIDAFFDAAMTTQTPTPGAVDALHRLSRHADIVVLTNVPHSAGPRRSEELARHGMPYPVICNDGPKGPPVAKLIAEREPGAVVFIDDLPPHHRSVRAHAPDVHRLHMVADHRLRALAPDAADAHVRIDDWDAAFSHILQVIG